MAKRDVKADVRIEEGSVKNHTDVSRDCNSPPVHQAQSFPPLLSHLTSSPVSNSSQLTGVNSSHFHSCLVSINTKLVPSQFTNLNLNHSEHFQPKISWFWPWEVGFHLAEKRYRSWSDHHWRTGLAIQPFTWFDPCLLYRFWITASAMLDLFALSVCYFSLWTIDYLPS